MTLCQAGLVARAGVSAKPGVSAKSGFAPGALRLGRGKEESWEG